MAFKKLFSLVLCFGFIATSCSNKEVSRETASEASLYDIYGTGDFFIKIKESPDKQAVNFTLCPIPLKDERTCEKIGEHEFYLKSDLEKLHNKIVTNAAGKFTVIIAATLTAGLLVGKDPNAGRGAANLFDTGRNLFSGLVSGFKKGTAMAGTGIVSTLILNPSRTLTQAELTKAKYITGSEDLVTQTDINSLVKNFKLALSIIDNNQL